MAKNQLQDEEYNEELILDKGLLERATAYLNSINISTISVYGKNSKLMNIKSSQARKDYSVKDFFIKLCHTSGLYKAISNPGLQYDINFALLCIEQQPLCYPDLPETIQKDASIMTNCNSALKNYDRYNSLVIDYDKFSLDDINLLLRAKLATRHNSEGFIRFSRDNPKVLDTDFLKEIIKYNPNILEYAKHIKYDPDVIEFVNNLSLADSCVSIRRIIGKKIDDEYVISQKDQEIFAQVIENQKRLSRMPYAAIPIWFEQ